MLRSLFTHIAFCIALLASAATVTEQPIDYRGSRATYPVDIKLPEYPDSLTPVMINHVGRHGARYATSPRKIYHVIECLSKADSAGTITEKGLKMLHLAKQINNMSHGHWGELDSIGIAEQEGIALRMYHSYAPIFNKSDLNINAISSYVPRCVMSMYAFCHQLTQLNTQMAIIASSGPQYNPLMRPFETSQAFISYSKEKPYQRALNRFRKDIMPHNVASDMMGQSYPMTPKQADDLADDIYYLVSSCSAIGVDVNPMEFFTPDEYRRLWEAANVQQYLLRNANSYSSVPANIAAALVIDLITSTQNFIDGKDLTPVHLRFGHAETIMPLVSLLHLPGCYAPMDCPLSEISDYWQNSNVIPMAANLQLILFRSDTGQYYLKVELNEQPVEMIKGHIYAPWYEAREYMLNRIPTR